MNRPVWSLGWGKAALLIEAVPENSQSRKKIARESVQSKREQAMEVGLLPYLHFSGIHHLVNWPVLCVANLYLVTRLMNT